MTYAIIETGGKQLRVELGRFYDVERLAVDENEKVTIDRVLFVENDGSFSVGQPIVEGATVEATVLRHLRGRKIIVYKMRPKKKTRKKQGHRQELTRLMIDAINLGGQSVSTGNAVVEPELVTVAEEPAEEAEASLAVEPEVATVAGERTTEVETSPVVESEVSTATEEPVAEAETSAAVESEVSMATEEPAEEVEEAEEA